MRADLREALDEAAPRHVPELDFDRLWRRRRRARIRSAATALAAMALLAGLIADAVVRWGRTVELDPAAPPADLFVGAWESLDLDGSAQHMTIQALEDGTYRVEMIDDSSTVCGGTPATAGGVGTLAGATRMTIAQVYRCEDGTVLTEIDGIRLDHWLLAYDAAANLITDPAGVVWHRPGEEAPALDAHESWTVETSLGTWTWTFVPHHAGASRLWSEAISRLTDDAGLFGVPVRDVPLPQITGMAWTAWAPEVAAGSGDDTLAVVGLEGEIDWATVYGLDPADEWIWSEWRHGPSSTTVELGQGLAAPFAILVATLVGSDPGAVEFHDEETGDLVLRLESTDPQVSAEQLFTSPPMVWSLLVDPGDGWRVVDPPWQRLPVSGVKVTPVAGGFVAVAVDPGTAAGRTSQLHRWASPDGVQWQALGPPLPLGGEGAVPMQLLGDDGRLLLLVERRGRTSVWTSSDGANWEEAVPELPTWSSWLSRTAFGWVLASMDGGCQIWASANGAAWERIPFQPEVESRSGVEAPNCSVIDDEVYVQIEEVVTNAADDDPPFRPLGLWIGQLEQ